MSRLIFAAFAFMVLFSVATAEECPDDEVYLECGTLCPPTCLKPFLQVCPLICVPGCFCKVGLIRNSNGKCVPPIACLCDL